MKIIYGITKSDFGGAQRYVLDIATASKKNGLDTAVICGGQGLLTEKLRNENIRTISIPYMKRDFSLVEEVRSLYFIFHTLRIEKPDVFHTNSSKMGGLGAVAARLAGIKKIIFTAHGWEFNAPRRSWYARLAIKLAAWLTILLSHKTICVSDKTRRDVSSLPFTKSKLVVIHNGIDQFEILQREVARQELGLNGKDGLMVGTIAELHPVKGLDTLILAWDSFMKKNRGKLIIFGEGDMRKELEEFIDILELKDSVELKGYTKDARRYLSALDVFVLPSRSEAMPYTVLEAGLAGIPTIATNVGGIPEIIQTGSNGILVDKNEPESIFSSLVLLSGDKSLRDRLGTALKDNILKNFSVRNMAEKTFSLY